MSVGFLIIFYCSLSYNIRQMTDWTFNVMAMLMPQSERVARKCTGYKMNRFGSVVSQLLGGSFLNGSRLKETERCIHTVVFSWMQSNTFRCIEQTVISTTNIFEKDISQDGQNRIYIFSGGLSCLGCSAPHILHNWSILQVCHLTTNSLERFGILSISQIQGSILEEMIIFHF